MKKKSKKKVILITLTIVLAVILIGGKLFMTNTQNNLDQLSEMSIRDADLSVIADGEYPGDYSVFPISVKVLVTIKDHSIAKIDLIEHQNGKGGAAESLLQKVVETQSLKVDTASGATYSSKVILKSIENALQETAQ